MEVGIILGMNKTSVISFIIVIVLAVLSRVYPHIPNVVPITALALYSGVYVGKRISIVIPLVIMVISDLILGIHSTIVFVYGSFVLISMLGIWLSSHRSLKNTVLITFFSSTLFFLITNFGVWVEGRMYALSISGLIECYTMAIPFFRNTLLGDFFYVGLFFGARIVIVNVLDRKAVLKA